MLGRRILTGSMPVIDVETGEELGRGEVPSWCVAVRHSSEALRGGEFGLPAVLVLKRLEEGNDTTSPPSMTSSAPRSSGLIS